MNVYWNAAFEHPALARQFVSLSKQAKLFEMLGRPHHMLCPLASPEELRRVHDKDYVHGVLEGVRHSGFSAPASPVVLQHILASNGCMIHAVAVALGTGRGLHFVPVSGFHHAGHAQGGGYCTFNGLLAAVANARALGKKCDNVLIIDGDAHYGNGTDDILATGLLPGVVNLTHEAPDRDRRINRETWHHDIEAALNRAPWDLVLYQAGADAHREDPYLAGYLDDGAWLDRDRLVFKWAEEHGVPCVWNLAGGYGDLTLNLHKRTYSTALRFARPA